MKIQQILENTTAGSVATVAQPLMTQSRENTNVRGLKPVQQVMKGKASKKGPYANSIVESKVTEDDLAEQDLIVIPGQGRLKRTGFVKHDLDQGEHEGHTLKNSLHTIARAAMDLDKRLSVQSEFPEWVSEKIGAAKGMMVSVMDYLISSQEMQQDTDAMAEGRWVTPKQEKVPKSTSTVSLNQLLKNKKQNPGQSPFKTQDEKVKKHLGPDEKGVAEGSKEKTPGIALSKAYKKDFDDKKPGQDRAETALTGTYSKTGKPGGELKKKGVAEGQLDELNRDTVTSYADKAEKDQDKQFTTIGKGIRDKDPKSANKAGHKFSMRSVGLGRAEKRLQDKTVEEGAMPASVIRVKEKIRLMTDAEKKEYFKGKTQAQLQQMARRHGYGENSKVYAKYATQGVTEVSDATKASYKEKATQQVKDLTPDAKKGEYKDIAQNMISRRQKGIDRVTSRGVAEGKIDQAWNAAKKTVSEGFK